RRAAGARAGPRGGRLHRHAPPARGRSGLLRPGPGSRDERRVLEHGAARLDGRGAVRRGIRVTRSHGIGEMEGVGTKADDIALEIEEAIVSGELAPGEVLRQDRLSERYGVSRTPIREALRRLAALGLVSFEPNRGVRVRTLAREGRWEA